MRWEFLRASSDVQMGFGHLRGTSGLSWDWLVLVPPDDDQRHTLFWDHLTWLHPHKLPNPRVYACSGRQDEVLVSSAQECRKPLPCLHQETFSYLHPLSPQYRPMVQELRGLPRSPSTRTEVSLLAGASKPLGAAPWLREVALSCSWLCCRATMGAGAQEASVPALVPHTWGLGLPADGGGTPTAVVVQMGTPSPSRRTSPGPAPDTFPGLSFLTVISCCSLCRGVLGLSTGSE